MLLVLKSNGKKKMHEEIRNFDEQFKKMAPEQVTELIDTILKTTNEMDSDAYTNLVTKLQAHMKTIECVVCQQSLYFDNIVRDLCIGTPKNNTEHHFKNKALIKFIKEKKGCKDTKYCKTCSESKQIERHVYTHDIRGIGVFRVCPTCRGILAPDGMNRKQLLKAAVNETKQTKKREREKIEREILEIRLSAKMKAYEVGFSVSRLAETQSKAVELPERYWIGTDIKKELKSRRRIAFGHLVKTIVSTKMKHYYSKENMKVFYDWLASKGIGKDICDLTQMISFLFRVRFISDSAVYFRDPPATSICAWPNFLDSCESALSAYRQETMFQDHLLYCQQHLSRFDLNALKQANIGDLPSDIPNLRTALEGRDGDTISVMQTLDENNLLNINEESDNFHGLFNSYIATRLFTDGRQSEYNQFLKTILEEEYNAANAKCNAIFHALDMPIQISRPNIYADAGPLVTLDYIMKLRRGRPINEHLLNRAIRTSDSAFIHDWLPDKRIADYIRFEVIGISSNSRRFVNGGAKSTSNIIKSIPVHYEIESWRGGGSVEKSQHFGSLVALLVCVLASQVFHFFLGTQTIMS